MTDYIKLQLRCQRGEPSLAGANNLLAECHAALGKLMADNKRLESAVNQSLNLDFERRQEIGDIKVENEELRKDA